MKSKKIALMTVVVVTLVFLVGISVKVEARSTSMKSTRNLVGVQAKWTQQLKMDKKFAKKRVLLIVKGEKKSSTVNGLLAAVEKSLSDSQHSVFVVPLIIAENQDADYASVDVSGTVIRKLTLSGYQPNQHRGVAALVLQYEGDTTLPQQVLVTLETE